jgi:CubicO group peptidase (beta-lactamase class C family)
MFSTVADMQRFAAALLQNRLTSPAMTAALTSREFVAMPAANGRPGFHYGFGFGVGTMSGHRWFGHNGGALGLNAEFIIFPDDQWTVVVLSNRDPPMATNLLRYVNDMLLDPAKLATCGQAAATRS